MATVCFFMLLTGRCREARQRIRACRRTFSCATATKAATCGRTLMAGRAALDAEAPETILVGALVWRTGFCGACQPGAARAFPCAHAVAHFLSPGPDNASQSARIGACGFNGNSNFFGDMDEVRCETRGAAHGRVVPSRHRSPRRQRHWISHTRVRFLLFSLPFTIAP